MDVTAVGKLLLEHNVVMEAIDKHNKRSIFPAVCHNWGDVQLLLKQNRYCSKRWRQRSSQVAEVILEHNTDIEVRAEPNWTPVNSSAQYKDNTDVEAKAMDNHNETLAYHTA